MKKRSVLSVLVLASMFCLAGCTNNSSQTPSSETPSSTTIAVTGVTITSANNVRSIKEGETLQLTATVLPEGANQGVTWTSSSETNATVSNTGLVTAVKAGNVTITATSTADTTKSATFSLVIEKGEDPLPTAITVTASSKEVEVGGNLTLSVTVTPENAKDAVTWSSSDEAKATVSAAGVVRGIAEGEVTITATSKEAPTVKGSITLTVKPATAPTPTTDWSKLDYSTHDEFMEAENDTALKIKGVVTFVSPASEDNEINYYIQNDEGGFYVYAQNSATFPVEAGKVYEVGGYKALYAGQHELKEVELCKELSETITADKEDISDKNVSDAEAMSAYYGSYVSVTEAKVKEADVNEKKAYNITLTLGEYELDVRVDPSMMTDAEFAAINEKVKTAVVGAEASVSGIMSLYGWGKASPQLMLMKAADLVLADPEPEEWVAAAKTALTLPFAIEEDVTTINLPKTLDGYKGVTISYASSNETVLNGSTGAVTHQAEDTMVTVTATITCEDVSDTKEFVINVFGTAVTDDLELVHTFNCEDCTAGSYGNAAEKSSYAAGTVKLGTPEKKTWMLDNVLIGSLDNDFFNGTYGMRGRKESHIRLEEDINGIVFFDFQAAVYGTDSAGPTLTFSYLPVGATGEDAWKQVNYTVVLAEKELNTVRVTLPEEASRISIDATASNGSDRYNVDDLRLYTEK